MTERMALKLLLFLPLVGFVVAPGVGNKLLSRHGAENKDISHSGYLERVKRGYDPKMCLHLPNMYFDDITNSCMPCCFTTEDQLTSGGIVKECQIKNKKCDMYAIFSACPRNNPVEWPEPGTPPSSVCTAGKNSTTTDNPTPSPIQGPTPWPIQDPTPSPIQDPTPYPTTTEAGSDPTDQMPSTTDTSNGEPWWREWIIGGGTVVIYVVLTIITIVCLKCYIDRKRTRSTSPSINNGTVNLEDNEALLPEDRVSVSQACIPERPTDTDTVEESNENERLVSQPPIESLTSTSTLATVLPRQSSFGSASAPLEDGNYFADGTCIPLQDRNVTGEIPRCSSLGTADGAPLKDHTLLNRKDSGFSSGYPSPQIAGKEFLHTLTRICSTFISETAIKCQKPTCDDIGELKSLPELEKAGHETAVNLIDDQGHTKDFGLCHLLKLIKDSPSFHPPEKSPDEFVKTVEQLLKIFGDDTRDDLSRSWDSVKSEDFLTQKERRDINGFLQILETHDYFPHDALKKDLDMVKMVLNTETKGISPSPSQLQEHLMEYGAEIRELRRRQEENNSVIMNRMGSLEDRQAEDKSQQQTINSDIMNEVELLGDRQAEMTSEKAISLFCSGLLKASHGNYIRCLLAVQLVLSKTIPCLQNAIDSWHLQASRRLQSCTVSRPNFCQKSKKPATSHKHCPDCISWAHEIESQLYRPTSGNARELQWSNADPTLFGKDPLEVIKVFALHLPANKISSLGDFDAASVLMIMANFKEFHNGNQTVCDQVKKVSKIRNESLAHLKLNKNLNLDNQTFKAYWTDITDLVNAIQSIGRRYFTQDTAQDIHDQLTQIKTEQPEALRPLIEDVLQQTLQELEKQPCLESDKREIQDLLKNKDVECKVTFSELLNKEDLMVEVTKLCDAEGKGERLTRTLADLLNCEDEYKHYAYYRGPRLSVIEHILEERENTSFLVLLACAYHFRMEGLINVLAGWHQDCPACKGLYRL